MSCALYSPTVHAIMPCTLCCMNSRQGHVLASRVPPSQFTSYQTSSYWFTVDHIRLSFRIISYRIVWPCRRRVLLWRRWYLRLRRCGGGVGGHVNVPWACAHVWCVASEWFGWACSVPWTCAYLYCYAMQLMEWGGGCLGSLNLHPCLMPAELIWWGVMLTVFWFCTDVWLSVSRRCFQHASVATL